MNYLYTTDSGDLHFMHVRQGFLGEPSSLEAVWCSDTPTCALKLLEYKNKSIYTSSNGLRFIKKYGDNYIIGASEELLIFRNQSKPEVIGSFTLPGLVDIKDIVIGDNFIAILSGLRDSVYVLNKELSQVLFCFNIGQNGNLEFFRERQMQCQEINTNYFQVFYCPGMNNYHKFFRLIVEKNMLYILAPNYSYLVNLVNFSHTKQDSPNTNDRGLRPDGVTDFIEC